MGNAVRLIWPALVSPEGAGTSPRALRGAVGCLLLAVCLGLPITAAGQSEFPDVCADDPANQVRNCEFNAELDHWRSFVESGTRPRFSVESSTEACHSPDCPALRILAEEWFVGGIYQRVSGAVPGQAYWANVIWLVYDPAGALDNTVGRRIGIDPTGGTDPRSANVVWSPNVWVSFANCPYKICRELHVQAVAKNTTVTLFVRIEDTWKNRRDEFPDVPPDYDPLESFWIDDVGMIPAAPPTPTPLPPPVSTLVDPNSGGQLVSNDADGSVTVDIPPGAVDRSSVVTYTYQVPPPLAGRLGGNDRFFRLEAEATHFSRPVTIVVRYPAINPLVRDSIGLYRLSGTTWVTDDITTIERTDAVLTSTTAQFSSFGLLGETNRCYIPAIMR